MPACSSMTTAINARQSAASAPLAAYRRSRNRRKLFLRAVGLEDRLAVGAGGLLPLLRHLLADLLESGLHGGVGIAHAHAVLGECLVAFLLARLGHVPAALLGASGRLHECVLLRFRQAGEAALVDHHHVLWVHGARLVVVLDELPGLGRGAGGR